MKFPHKQLKGVTLIELLVVLMVVVILAGVTITIINPVRQNRRAQDAALINAVSSIVQTLETINGVRGAYPTQSATDRNIVRDYMTAGWAVNNATAADCNAAPSNCGLRFSHPGIVVGRVANAQIVYQIPKNGANTTVCIQARTNEDTARFIAWAPGYEIRNIGSFCNTAAGWAELIAP